MRIHRSHPDEQFAIIPNATLRDHRLSALARSVLFDLLSHADGWETNADAYWRRAQQAHGEKIGEGRRAHRAAFAELETYGYMVRRTVKVKRGRFATLVDVYDTPGHQGDATGSTAMNDPWATAAHGGTADGSPVDGTAVGGMAVTGTSSRSTNLRTTNKEDASEEHSTALADTRAAAADASARDNEADLQGRYESVRRLSDTGLRDAMLAFERKRPRIFRECRRDALAQLEAKDKSALKVGGANVGVDRLSYMYALRHYAPDWPAWLLRPLPDPRKLRAA